MTLPPKKNEGFGSRFRLTRPTLAGCLLVFAVLLVYEPVWHAGYLWDDDILLTINPCIVGPPGFKESNLGLVYLRQGWPDEALTQCREAVRLKPDFTEAQHDLAAAQSMAGPAASPP